VARASAAAEAAADAVSVGLGEGTADTIAGRREADGLGCGGGDWSTPGWTAGLAVLLQPTSNASASRTPGHVLTSAEYARRDGHPTMPRMGARTFRNGVRSLTHTILVGGVVAVARDVLRARPPASASGQHASGLSVSTAVR